MNASGLKEGDRIQVQPEYRSDDWVDATYMRRHNTTWWGPALRGCHWVRLDAPIELRGAGPDAAFTEIVVPSTRIRKPRKP